MILRQLLCVWIFAISVAVLIGCDQADTHRESIERKNPSPGITQRDKNERSQSVVVEQADPKPALQTSPPLIAAARSQVSKTVRYDPAYVGLSYPGGDLPIERGVCTDVVIRAMREAYDMDLQRLVHEDMTQNFSAYPDIWGLTRTDKNIDHRRVPNLRRYFERHGHEVTSPNSKYLPGDVVTCSVGNRPHIMVVSDRSTPSGKPLVIHNIGRGTVEEDRLTAFTITGHYRIKRLENTED